MDFLFGNVTLLDGNSHLQPFMKPSKQMIILQQVLTYSFCHFWFSKFIFDLVSGR